MAASGPDPLLAIFKLVRAWRGDGAGRITDEMFNEFLELWERLCEERSARPAGEL